MSTDKNILVSQIVKDTELATLEKIFLLALQTQVLDLTPIHSTHSVILDHSKFKDSIIPFLKANPTTDTLKINARDFSWAIVNLLLEHTLLSGIYICNFPDAEQDRVHRANAAIHVLAMKSKTLEVLMVAGACTNEGTGLHENNYLAECPMLHTLNIKSTDIDSSQVIALSKSKSLRILNIADNDISAESVIALICNSQLQYLDISGCRFSDSERKTIADALLSDANQTLTQVIGLEGIPELDAILQKPIPGTRETMADSLKNILPQDLLSLIFSYNGFSPEQLSPVNYSDTKTSLKL